MTVSTRPDESYRPPPPAAIGPYRVTGTLGEGGMGVVYAAEQEHPIRRRVAVKLIREGRAFTEIVARFALERQALALMEHPSIARVLDAGTTPRGEPYFVMEYVDGAPITTWCDGRRLSVRERLALFLPVCHAVQHAHQKGVIHRDLKPTNVLVTEQAGAPCPKVIDFGIAKAVGGLAPDALLTATGLVVGTPAYMSPEQAHGGGADVDTRTDVFALGVMLYELLTGSLPADPAQLGLPAFISRLVSADTIAPAPSARVDTEAATIVSTVAASRGTQPSALRLELRGDLDAIVLKAIAPERDRRYQTAQELAQDIERYLHHEPVLARTPGPLYRLRKLARRHPAAATLAASAAIFLVGLSAVMVVQNRRVSHARAVADQRRVQAEELISYMVGDLRGKLEPVGRLDILDGAADRALAYFAAVPASELSPAELFRRSQALGQLGQLHLARGQVAQAAAPFRESLTLARDLAARDSSNAEWQVGLGAAHFWLGYVHFEQGALDSALAQFRPYLDISERLVERDSTRPEWHLELGYAHSNIGSVLEAQGKFAEALAAFRYTLAVKRRLVALDTADLDRLYDLAVSENTAGRALERLGRLEEAATHYAADLAIKRRLVARDTANATWAMGLSTALSYAAGIDELRGRTPAALARLDSVSTMDAALMARDGTNAEWARGWASSTARAAALRLATGDDAAARAGLRRAHATMRQLVARDSSSADYRIVLAQVGGWLAAAELAEGDLAAARTHADDAARLVEPLAARRGADRRAALVLAQAQLVRGALHARAGRPADARAAHEAALAALGPEAGEELAARETRARALAGLGRADEARALARALARLGYARAGFAEFTATLPVAPTRPR